jgi:hypothetical protein
VGDALRGGKSATRSRLGRDLVAAVRDVSRSTC